MKSQINQLCLLVLGFITFFSCTNKNKKTDVNFPYQLTIKPTTNNNAPALQSFIHGVDGDNWLLFAGRTNSVNDNGGLHNMNANYANQSFPPPSYNENIYVYNVKKDSLKKISLDHMIKVLENKFPENYKAVKDDLGVFRNSNALVKQNGDYLYVIGGYGPKDINNPKKDYITYNHVAKIHVKSMINLVTGKYNKVIKDKLFTIAHNDTLKNTGGEMMLTTGQFGNTMNVIVGQQYDGNSGNQKYADAVFSFNLNTNKENSHLSTATITNTISDVLNPMSSSADHLSNFRRRDGPVLPALFQDPVSGNIQQGINICTGVFKPGNVNQAWNDAIYVHPEWANNEGRLFTQDKAYNQNNFNVYSCPSFVVYDSINNTTHSFLMGGIGDGKYSTNGNLSGFTNTAVHIRMNIGKFPYSSSHSLISSKNLFTQKAKNEAPYYGAEAIFFSNKSIEKFFVNKSTKSSGTETEVFDMSKFSNGDIEVGYIFGGIEAFKSNPSSYGPRKSRASNKIWKVILKKK